MKAIDKSGRTLRDRVVQTLRIRLIRLYEGGSGFNYCQAELHGGGLLLRQKTTMREHRIDICREEAVRLAKLILVEYGEGDD